MRNLVWLAAAFLGACSGTVSPGDQNPTGDTRGGGDPEPSLLPPIEATDPVEDPPVDAGDSGIWSGDIRISRSSGVAPLAVLFDASEISQTSTDLSTFRELDVRWDFDDENSGRWPTSGRLRATEYGPVAGHVFETPGSYQVSAHVRDRAGNAITYETTIVVADPNQVFAGDQTLCVSVAGDFQGCPDGAAHMTSSSYSEALSSLDQHPRVLFRRGEAWTASSGVDLNEAGPGSIGAFGDGPKPIINTTAGLINSLSGSTPELEDWRIADLAYIGTNLDVVFSAESTVRQLLLLQLDMFHYHNGVVIPANKPDYYGHPMHDQVAIVDSRIYDINGIDGAYGVFVASTDLLVLGTSVVDLREGAHNLRVQYTDTCALMHNTLAFGRDNRHVLKLHAEESSSAGPRTSRRFAITANTFIGEDNSWTVSVGPQSSSYSEAIEDGLIANNYFLAGPGTQSHLHMAARRVTVRNNIVDLTNGIFKTGISVVQRGVEPSPIDNAVQHNTCFSADSDDVTCVHVGTNATNTTVEGNLLVAPNSSRRHVVVDDGSGNTLSGNLELADGGLAAAMPAVPADYELTSGSPAIDAGGTACVARDHWYSSRPADGDNNGTAACDVGAFELR